MTWKDYIEKIQQIQAEIATLGPLSPENQYKLWQRIRLDWNYHSNSMEGNTLTMSETETLILHGIHAGNKFGRHYDEIKLHNNVLLGLQDIIRNETPITEHLIRGLHAEMMGNEYYVDAQDNFGNAVKKAGRSGEYKNSPNFVQRGGEETYYYVAVENVEPEMRDLIDWLREEEAKKEKHPIEIAMEFHLKFLTIHPFDDGNGRMGRILMNLILMKSGLAPAVIQRDEKPEYLNALVQAQSNQNKLPLLNLLAKETYNAMQLRLKAYRGEPLERLDDWEKEAELLKQQLEESEIPLLEKTRELVYDAYYASVDGLFARFIQKMQTRFASFFLNQYTYYRTNSPAKNYEKMELDEVLKRSIEDSKSSINSISISFEMRGFKKLGHEQVSIYGVLEVRFDQFYYVIQEQHKQDLFTIKKRYTQEITMEEGDKLIAQIGKGATEYIKRVLSTDN